MPLSFDRLVLGPCAGAFGEAAQGYPLPVYTPAGGPPAAVDGIFDEAYREIDQLTGLPVTSEMPVFGVRLSLFAVPPATGDAVAIRGQNFIVREVRPDGHGHAKLMLNQA